MTTTNINKVLSRQELATVLKRSNLKALWSFTFSWGLIFASLAAAGLWPNPVTIVLAIVLISGRQLGLAILMHDCAHSSLFTSRKVNQFFGEWLSGAPLLARLDGYRTYHLNHHNTAGTDDDPDLPNYRNYPVSVDSLKRKAIRDLTGRTGLKNLKVILAMNLGLIDYELSYAGGKSKAKPKLGQIVKSGIVNLFPAVLSNVILFMILMSFGIGWTYLLWAVSYFTVYQFFLRIRNAAEHAVVAEPYSPDPRLHTRTTLASWWERLTFGPSFVNFHLEHHLLPAVPGYNLPQLHTLLMAKEFLPSCHVASGYWEVIKVLVGKEPRPIKKAS